MSRYSDLEIAFRKRDERSYLLSFRFNSEDDAAEQRGSSEPVVPLDLAALAGAGDDPQAYSQALTAAFFTPEVREQFNTFRAIAQTLQSILRVRLTIGPDAVELHSVHWETLGDPFVEGAHLFTGEQTIVSRFLASGNDWRPVRLRPQGKLRALVVVANPPSSAAFGLDPVDVPAENALAVRAMAGMHVDLWPRPTAPLADLAAQLRDDYDVLYLVCHGRIVDNDPCLYLDDGRPVSGLDLVQAIRGLDHRPRMVVLASCQSAGKAGVGLAALGPRLAEAGVPAVVAMQGNVFMATAADFLQRFFSELLIDGQIDRAMSVARGQVLKATDYWAPVLFLRLRDGCLWYQPGFGGGQASEFDKWRSICASIHPVSASDPCPRFIPILGPELGEDLFGGTEELARTLAEQHNYPLAAYERLDLAKVAQFISVEQKRSYACGVIQNEFVRQVAGRFATPGAPAPGLGPLLETAAAACRADQDQPFRILSDLPACIYLNASYNPMLLRILKAAGKSPEPLFASWRGDEVPQKPQPQNRKPTPDAPWVYHIFGLFGKPNSLVLTEDDFVDYLIATSRLNLLLDALTGQLMQSSLLFLGFRLNDWRFRVLFRLIVTCQGAGTLRERSHVGVQVDPSEWNASDAGKARRYIESYFQSSDSAPEISIYWGTPADFLRQLRDQLAQSAQQNPVPVLQGASDEWF